MSVLNTTESSTMGSDATLLFHLRTAYLFVRSDIKTILVPVVSNQEPWSSCLSKHFLNSRDLLLWYRLKIFHRREHSWFLYGSSYTSSWSMLIISHSPLKKTNSINPGDHCHRDASQCLQHNSFRKHWIWSVFSCPGWSEVEIWWYPVPYSADLYIHTTTFFWTVTSFGKT